MSTRRKRRVYLSIAVPFFAIALAAGCTPTAPGVTVSPNTGLTDGQTVTITQSNFLSAVIPRGSTIVPAAWQCRAGVFASSLTFEPGTAGGNALIEQLLENCTHLGKFEFDARSAVFPVTRSFTAAYGAAVDCGTNGCAVAVIGYTGNLNTGGLATTGICFA